MGSQVQKLGLPSIILLGVNTIIGSGIFLLPGKLTALIGSWSLIAYGLVSLLVLSIAWCFAKCAALFNRDGGAYLYAKQAFGDFIGFEIGIMRWAVGIIAWAALAVGFVTAISSIWPEAILEPIRSILIIALVSCLGVVNMFNFRMVAKLNNVITIAKLVPLLFFVGAGVFYIKKSNWIPLTLPEIESHAFGAASLIIFYAFGGYETLVVAAGEMKNPQKNLPIAVMTVIIVCALFYFLIQLIAICALGPALSESISPIADVAEMLLGPFGKIGVTIAMLISIGGVNLAASLITPKNGVVLAEDGMIPSIIAKKNKQGIPYTAVLLTVFATGVLALSGNFTQLVAISAVSRFAQAASTCLAVFVFYKKQLTLKQPLCQSLAMGIPVVALCGIIWLITETPFVQLVYGLAVLFLAAPFYIFWRPRACLHRI